MNRRQRLREALRFAKIEIQIVELAVSDLSEAVAETAHQTRLFADACRAANAASGGKLFPALRAEA